MVGKEFTFQSGTIQAKEILAFGDNYNTLHSNLVQFKQNNMENSRGGYGTLHSNLVQFKRYTRDRTRKHVRLYIPIWYNSSQLKPGDIFADSFFTFQSGTIQAKMGNVYYDIKESFTFQSGTIQAVTR